MNLDLAKALGEIEKGAEQRLRVRRVEFEQLQQEMGEKQVIVGHIKKKEELQEEEAMEGVQAEKTVEQDDTTATEEENPWGVPRRHKTQSITALKKVAIEAKIKEQKRRYEEATKWRCATEIGLGEVDLEQEMELAGDVKSTSVATTVTTTVTKATASSSSCVVVAEVYAKPYTKTTELRGERSTARSEQREAMEKELLLQRQKEEVDRLVN